MVCHGRGYCKPRAMGRSSVTSFVAWWGSYLRAAGGAEEGAPPLPLLDVGGSKRTNNGQSKSEIQGSLHCTTDDEAVRGFGRDDVGLGMSDKPCCVAEEVPQRLKPHC